LLDRMIFVNVKPFKATMAEKILSEEHLARNYPSNAVANIFKIIYVLHEDTMTYTLDEDAQSTYNAFVDELAEEFNRKYEDVGKIIIIFIIMFTYCL
jgi:hypothetical protein